MLNMTLQYSGRLMGRGPSGRRWESASGGAQFLTSAPATVAVVQSLSCVRLFATPWTAARQASVSFTISQSLLKFVSTESGIPSNHPILYHPLFLLPSIFPSIRVFSTESVHCISIEASASTSVLPVKVHG